MTERHDDLLQDFVVLSSWATGVEYCADVVRILPDKLRGERGNAPAGEVPCIIRGTTNVEAPNVSHTLRVGEGDQPERTVGLVEVVSDGPIPCDRLNGKPPSVAPLSVHLEFRDKMDLGHLDPQQLEKRGRAYVAELRRRAEEPSKPDAKQDTTRRATPKHRVSEQPTVPTYPAHYRRWYRIWTLVQREAKKGEDYKDISTWLKRTHRVVCSPETLADIIRAGEAGLLVLGRSLKSA